MEGDDVGGGGSSAGDSVGDGVRAAKVACRTAEGEWGAARRGQVGWGGGRGAAVAERVQGWAGRGEAGCGEAGRAEPGIKYKPIKAGKSAVAFERDCCSNAAGNHGGGGSWDSVLCFADKSKGCVGDRAG